MLIVHEWMEARMRWPMFLGVTLFFGGFVYVAGGFAPALVMMLVIGYPLAMACFNRTEFQVENGYVRWAHLPVYSGKGGKVSLSEVTACAYGPMLSKKGKSDPVRYGVGIRRQNGKLNKIFTGLRTEAEAEDFAKRCAALLHKPLERMPDLRGETPSAPQRQNFPLLAIVIAFLLLAALALYWMGR